MILTSNELVLPFGGSYICANFDENRSRNATVRVPTDGHTDIEIQTQTDFIICPMLYAIGPIAIGQIINKEFQDHHTALAWPDNKRKRIHIISLRKF